ncbi:MAG: MarR family transcriptional regulator [Candidatus Hydrogenedentes bacterium]|nr:MarR family transcriptional regulator [Candidatus Hydrogenedentota bacterium]
MNADVIEQARYLFDTVRMLQARMCARHSTVNGFVGKDGHAQDLTIPQMHMLYKIRELDSATIRDLAESLYVSAPSASAMVERLVEMGVVTREQSRVDRREVIVRVAPAGEHTLETLEKHILESFVDILNGIGPEHAQMWCDVYARIREVLSEEQGRRASESAAQEA